MAKVFSNKRRTLWAATVGSNPFADVTQPTDAEINAMLKFSAVVKWDSTDLGVQESNQIDDRVLTDEGTAQRAGLAQFGGTVNLLTPKDPSDTNDTSVQVAALFATLNMREELWIVERVVSLATSDAAPGDTVTVYKVMTDAKKNQTEGESSYSYAVTLLSRGTLLPQYVVANGTTAGAITLTGYDAGPAAGSYTWGKATYEGIDITNLADFTVSDPTILSTTSNGIVKAIASGTATLIPSYPGAAVHAGLSFTVPI
jgi:hypothetical protein